MRETTARPVAPGPVEDDVVDLLLAQHARIEELFLLVVGGTGQLRRDAFDDLVRLLAAHETAEEEVVHPLSRTLPGGGGDAMVDERLAEEKQAKQTLKALVDAGVDDAGFETGILLLREAVLTHARYEERYEFPRLRQHVPAERLRALAAAVRAAEKTAPTRPHPSAQSATANLALGPALAVMDRVRDAVRRPSAGRR
ncbi:hemerythrin domain-containing protein [Micromonospora haikouensis]|uniref:hemerythrin domain-containing protein n=1 Tax=Micromonospora haikouensis TaxID=686309 RepID=UPI003D7324B0